MKTKVFLSGFAAFALTLPMLADDVAPQQDAQTATPAPAAEETTASDSSLPGYVSPWTTEVKKLVDARVDDSVVMEFVNASGTFNLTTPQIVALNEQSFPSEVLTAMLQHDAEYAAGLRGNPPVPTVRPIRLKLIAPKNPTTAQSTRPKATESESIVNPSPAPDFPLDEIDVDFVPETPAVQNSRPVRESVPVRLTTTIVVFRSASRVPNVQTLEMFPSDTLAR